MKGLITKPYQLWHFALDSVTFLHKDIACKFGPHPFEWLSGGRGIKGINQNLWKDISNKLPSFSHFVCCVVGQRRVRKHSSGVISAWGQTSLLPFPHLYHLSFSRNHFVSDFFIWLGSPVSFFFGFNRSLTDREATNVISLLSLGKFNFRYGRKDLLVQNLNPLEGFFCNSIFCCLVNPSPSQQYVFQPLED